MFLIQRTPAPVLFLIPWLLWGTIWFVTAFSASRAVWKQPAGIRVLNLALLVGGAALLALHFNRPVELPWRFVPPDAPVLWIGFLLLLAGFVFAVWARLTLGSNWSGRVTLKADHKIVRTGPYGLARHPIYTGMVAAALGTALGNGTTAALIGFALIALGCLLKIREEERLLLDHFGPEYQDYRVHVRRLIPFVW